MVRLERTREQFDSCLALKGNNTSDFTYPLNGSKHLSLLHRSSLVFLFKNTVCIAELEDVHRNHPVSLGIAASCNQYEGNI
jgi:hypothetical protein